MEFNEKNEERREAHKDHLASYWTPDVDARAQAAYDAATSSAEAEAEADAE